MSRITRFSFLSLLGVFLLIGGVLLAIPLHRNATKIATDKKLPDSSSKPSVDSNVAAPSIPIAPPGSILYTAKRGETVPGLIHKYLWQSSYMTAPEFEAAIRAANGNLKGVYLPANKTLVVPGIPDKPWQEKLVPVPRNYEVRAIYLTGLMAGSTKGINIVREWRKVGGNAVVFDIKDSNGWVNIKFDNRLAPPGDKVTIGNLAKYTHFLHSMGMHAIARIAIFRDEELVKDHPELAVRSRSTGKPWLEHNKLVWTDPSNPEVQAYNIALADYAAKSGVDEIQFDYVRFPAESDQKDARFLYEASHPEWQRSDVITGFLRKAYRELHPTGVLLSLDVFGVMAWERSVDLAHTGQDIPGMAKYCDVLSPMIYPSHFFGMDGYSDPGDAPEHFISESMKRFQVATKGTNVVLRPWLQAFGWRTKTYSPDYIRVQVATSKSNGGIGFLFWNARNDYSKPYLAMPEMAKDSAKYFRGDEFDKMPNPATDSSAPSAANSLAETASR